MIEATGTTMKPLDQGVQCDNSKEIKTENIIEGKKGLQGHKCHPQQQTPPASHSPTYTTTASYTQLPSMASVLTNPVPTVRSIKTSLFPLLKRIWDPVFRRIAAGDAKAWEDLATLPSHLLAATPRGGARGTATLKYRMESFLKNEAIPPPLTTHKDQKPFDKVEKAEASAKAGRLSLAAKHLFKNNTLLPYSHSVIKNLKRKHPAREYDSFGSPPCSPTLTLGDTMGAIESAPRSSSQDQWGYRYEHWQALLKAGASLHDFMKGVHCGSIPIPASIQPTWSGGNLLPFAKPQQPDDVRPIVISLTLRRLISRAALVHIQKSAKDFFLPFQFGNALPKLGLHLNPAKCTIFNKDTTLMQNNRGLTLSPEGIKVLGSFIGEEDFVARSVKLKVNMWAGNIHTLEQLKSFQLRLLMLRHTLAQNPNYLCRTTPTEGSWFTPLNSSMYNLLQGMLKSAIPPKNQGLVHWPAKQGGLGLPNFQAMHKICIQSSWHETQHLPPSISSQPPYVDPIPEKIVQELQGKQLTAKLQGTHGLKMDQGHSLNPSAQHTTCVESSHCAF
ncbi:hypothetical protein Pelo_2660 [Pelomyxa schiedti]|nr:hypothetical protein Pelo_2660 [Pelomyxa schiedti]